MALDTLDIVLSKILFHQPSKYDPAGVRFLIARATNGTTVKGKMRNPREGESYRMWGRFAAQKGYDEPAFEFEAHEVLCEESVAGVTQYLKNYVPGLGLVKASALVEEFGVDTLRTLRENPGLAGRVHGITDKIVEAIRKHFVEDIEFDPVAHTCLIDLFAAHKFPKKIVRLLLRDWGSDAPAKVVENPYMLLAYPRMGWVGVDAFATTTAGYARDGIARQVAAIVEALERLSDDGHTYGTKIDVEKVAFDLIRMVPEEVAWNVAIIDGLVDCEIDDGGTTPNYALPKLASAERTIAERITRLGWAAGPLPYSLDTTNLKYEQPAAVKIIEEHAVSILAGPPGTGKSVTLATVIADLDRSKFGVIRVVAPTGKAAKRTAELLDSAIPGNSIECTTIHRALGIAKSDEPEGVPSRDAKIGRGRDEFGFHHNEGNQLDVDFLVIEESSMADVSLAAALLSAVPLGARIVFVGDPNQLPSVGPGSVLRDLMAAGVPTTMLSTIQRSDGGGRVVRACHAIKDGRIPSPAPRVSLPTENWVHVEIDDPGEIAGKIVELHESAAKNGKYDPLWDMQVISPQKDKPPGICCSDLNTALGRLLNKRAWASMGGVEEQDNPDDKGAFDPAFRVGDKVVRTKNGLVDEMKSIGRAIKDGRPPATRTMPGSYDWVERARTASLEELGDEWGPISGAACGQDGGADDDQSGRPREDWRWQGRPYSLVETTVVNGDMGQITDIIEDDGSGKSWAVVSFRSPERLCRLPMGEPHLILAYALTVHKMQGSGQRYVIIPVHNSFHWDARSQTGLLCRELIYTAISRTEEVLVTVGQFSAIRSAISRRTVGHRRTRLVERLGEVMARDDRDDGGIAERALVRVSDLLDTTHEAIATRLPWEVSR